MSFRRYNQYLFSVDIPELEELQQWKSLLVEEYFKEFKINSEVNDITISAFDPKFYEFRSKLLPLIHEQVQKYFIIDKPWNDTHDTDSINVYVQNGVEELQAQEFTNSMGGFHNHNHHGTNLAGVCYLSLPKIGGGFETMHPPKWLSHIIKPEINKFYFFPSWLYHRPLPQQDKEPRICINWGCKGERKPILKRYNQEW